MSSDETNCDAEELSPIVIDNGSYRIKAGFGNQDVPRVEFPTKVGRPKQSIVFVGMLKDVYVGYSAQSMRGILHLTTPVRRGIMEDWDSMEKIWHHTFYNELRVNPADHKVLLTDSEFKASNREKMTQIMFETFDVDGLYISLQAWLAWYYATRTNAYVAPNISNGIVVDLGYEVTNIVPIAKGKVIPRGIERLDIGGKDITEGLIEMLSKSGWCYTTFDEKEIVNQMKEKFCYVGLDFDQELKAFDCGKRREKHYELPEGTMLPIFNEQVRAPEILFNPGTIGLECKSLTDSIQSSISNCSPEVPIDKISSHILLSGGGANFTGLNARLEKELNGISDLGPVKVISPAHSFHTWTGGAAYTANLDSLNKWITKEEYEEYGPAIVLNKCKEFLLD